MIEPLPEFPPGPQPPPPGPLPGPYATTLVEVYSVGIVNVARVSLPDFTDTSVSA